MRCIEARLAIPSPHKTHPVVSPSMNVRLCLCIATGILLWSGLSVNSASATDLKKAAIAPQSVADANGVAEARLIEIYKLIGSGQSREALSKADQLVADLPHFQLAQLVYGDLLAARTRTVKAVGDVPDDLARASGTTLKDLREESQRRILALKERPRPGTVPSQFLALSPKTKHAVAVDASRSRLYLFENSETGLTLVSDYYISVGKAGISKSAEGDQRTPLGVYCIQNIRVVNGKCARAIELFERLFIEVAGDVVHP